MYGVNLFCLTVPCFQTPSIIKYIIIVYINFDIFLFFFKATIILVLIEEE